MFPPNLIMPQKHQAREQTIKRESNKIKLKRKKKKKRYKAKLGDLNVFLQAYTKSSGYKILHNTFLDLYVADV